MGMHVNKSDLRVSKIHALHPYTSVLLRSRRLEGVGFVDLSLLGSLVEVEALAQLRLNESYCEQARKIIVTSYIKSCFSLSSYLS